jgi:putative transposase
VDVLVYQAFRFELCPNNLARSALSSHAGAARFAYNWGLATVSAHMAAYESCRELALRQGAGALEAKEWARTVAGPLPCTLPALSREWNRAKYEVAPWWASNSKEAYKSGLDALARALKGFLGSRLGERKGRSVGFPHFKKKGSPRSFRVTTGSFGVLDGRHARLPRIGRLRTNEPTAKLAAKLADGTARVLSASVSEHAGRWYVSFGCEVQRLEPSVPAGPAVGVDIGVKRLAVLSDGEVVENPTHVSRYARRMARLQRQSSRRRGPGKGTVASGRWRRSKANLARVHVKVANARLDGLHKLTTRLAKTYGTVVVEDLVLRAMTASAKGSGHWRGKAGLNRALLSSAPAELRRQLFYKCTWYGSKLVVANRWYPSSKTCSGCGLVKAKLALSERTFRCEHCGLVVDRDANAAANLAGLVKATSGTASGAGTSRGKTSANAQGEERFMPPGRCSSLNCEDSAGQPGQTATASAQAGAA